MRLLVSNKEGKRVTLTEVYLGFLSRSRQILAEYII
jgi:hypothetical protein